jgi:hypothetical protein
MRESRITEKARDRRSYEVRAVKSQRWELTLQGLQDQVTSTVQKTHPARAQPPRAQELEHLPSEPRAILCLEHPTS